MTLSKRDAQIIRNYVNVAERKAFLGGVKVGA